MEDKFPKQEYKYRKSKDGKYMIIKLVITDIKPIKYFEKVMRGDIEENKSELIETEEIMLNKSIPKTEE